MFALCCPTYTPHKTVSAVIAHLGLNLTCTVQITPKWRLGGTVGPTNINTHSLTHSWLCAGSGVEERNVKHLLAQPQRDPSAGQYRSAKSDSEWDISLAHTHGIGLQCVSHECRCAKQTFHTFLLLRFQYGSNSTFKYFVGPGIKRCSSIAERVGWFLSASDIFSLYNLDIVLLIV